MPEQWQCGYCDLIVELPPERDLDLYGAAIMFIRAHRFGHIADAFVDGSDEAVTGLCEDKPSGYSPYRRGAFGLHCERPVTDDDVAPAVEMAEAIVRRRA